MALRVYGGGGGRPWDSLRFFSIATLFGCDSGELLDPKSWIQGVFLLSNALDGGNHALVKRGGRRKTNFGASKTLF